MKIRKAQLKDFEEIAKIMMNESSKKPYLEKYTLKTALKETKKFSKNDLYISEEGKKITGFISSYITSDDKKKAYIDELWLKPNYQGKGIGTLLMKFIEEKYKKKGIKIIRLVTKRNAKAFGFYKKIKYKEHPELVFMEKKIKMMKIRKAQPKDSEAVLKLLNGDKFLTGNDDLKYEPKHIKEYIIGKAMRSYVCEENEKIIAFANSNIFPIARYAELYDLVVEKRYRKKGIGAKLFEYMVNQLKKEVDLVFFYTEVKNKIVHNLAKKEKFERGKKFYFYSKELK